MLRTHRKLRALSAKNAPLIEEGRVGDQESTCQIKATVKSVLERREMGTSAGVSVGEADAPTKSAATGGHGRAGGDYVVHKIERQELHEAARANDDVLFHGEAEETAHAATGG
jgi:hypothetical protein